MARIQPGRHRKATAARVFLRMGGVLLAVAIPSLVLSVPADLAGEAAPGPAPSGGFPLAAQLPAAGATSPPPSVRQFDIVASGDLLIHSPIYDLARTPGGYDFRPMFAQIRPIIRGAALAICHVETPIGAGAPSGYPVFNAPVELAAAIRWTGWDACDTASNHTVDKGQDGIDATLGALDRMGIRHAGSYRSAAEARRILLLDVQGVKIAFLAYAYGTNGIPAPHPWSVNLISLDKVRADAARARRLGANLVIANFHWGTEYVHAPNDQQTSLAAELLRRRIVDVIIGQHVHVVQPIQEMFRRFVVFGEGNLISNQSASCCPPESQDGLIAVIHVRAVGSRATVTGVDYIPTFVEHPQYVVLPAAQMLLWLTEHGAGRTVLADQLRVSYWRTVRFAGTGPHIRPIPGVLLPR